MSSSGERFTNASASRSVSMRPGVGPDLPGEGVRPADHARADRVREREVVERLADGARLDVDHAPASTFAEMGEAEVRQSDGGEQQELDGALDVIVGEARGGCARRAAAVVDEDVDPAERLERGLDQSLQVLWVGQVAADGQCSEPLRLALEQLAAAGEHRDVGALPGQRLGDCEADPGGRAADDRGPVVET
jgi:hypothetical protein